MFDTTLLLKNIDLVPIKTLNDCRLSLLSEQINHLLINIKNSATMLEAHSFFGTIKNGNYSLNLENIALKPNDIRINLLRESINHLFAQISACASMSEANSFFDSLDTIILLLTTLAFVQNINLPSDLQEIIRYFDRLDDQNERQYLFEGIKHNKYSIQNTKLSSSPIVQAILDKSPNTSYQELRRVVEGLLLRIKLCKTIEDASPYFHDLSTLVHFVRDAITILPHDLQQFFISIQQIDDPLKQPLLFDNIRNNNYYVCSEHEEVVNILNTIEINPIKTSHDERLKILHQATEIVLKNIKACSHFEEASTDIALLHTIITLLERIAFVDGIEIPTDLMRVLVEYCRLDKLEERHRLFDDIIKEKVVLYPTKDIEC